MQLKKREIDAIFKKLKLEIKSTHHKMAYLRYKGRKVLKTRRSHGKGDMKGAVIEQLINQLFLSKKQFQNLKYKKKPTKTIKVPVYQYESDAA